MDRRAEPELNGSPERGPRRVAVVIAAFDEVDSVAPLVDRLRSTFDAHPEFAARFIFVAAGDDGTPDLLAALAAREPRIDLLVEAAPSGLGTAMRRGFERARDGFDYVVTLDADLNHRPEEIPALLAAAESSGADVVIGSRLADHRTIGAGPKWKRWTSLAMNRLLAGLFELKARDLTSGFRVFRSETLRRLPTRRAGFAFTPELILAALREGARVEEVPIRFEPRASGRSKLPVLATALGYLGLVASGLARRSTILGWLAVGVLLRLAACLPLHEYPAEADCVLGGIKAFRILRGELPVFFNGLRIGSIACYPEALWVWLFGPTRLALFLGAFPWMVGQLVASIALLRRLVGDDRLRWALPLAAIAPPSVLFWTYMPISYAETLFFATAVPLAVLRALDRPNSARRWLVAGLVAGLALWTSALTAATILPSLALAAGVLRRGSIRVSCLIAGGLGFAAGFSPWLLFNLRYGFASLTREFPFRASAGAASILDNLEYTFTTKIQQLLAVVPVSGLGPSQSPPMVVPQTIVLAAWGALFVIAGFEIAARLRARFASHEPLADARAIFLLLAIPASLVLANTVSKAGDARGLSARYVLPLAIVLPLIPALAGGPSLATRRKRVVGLLVAILSALYLLESIGPWNSSRAVEVEHAREQENAIAALLAARVNVVVGSYWLVYPFNFFSRERLTAVPCEDGVDWSHRIELLPGSGGLWALADQDERRIAIWASLAGLPGRPLKIRSSFWIWLPDDPIAGSGPAFFDRLRRTHDEVERRLVEDGNGPAERAAPGPSLPVRELVSPRFGRRAPRSRRAGPPRA